MEMMMVVLFIALLIYYWGWTLISVSILKIRIQFLSDNILESFMRTKENHQLMEDDDGPADVG